MPFLRRILVALAATILACSGPRQTLSALSPEDEARALVQEGHAEQAIAALKHLREARPDDYGLARTWVQAHVQASRLEPLIAELKAHTAGPRADSPVDWYMLGLAYSARAASAEGPAQEAFRRAIALAPGQAELHYRLGLALLESDHESAALEPLTRAATLEPQRATFRVPLAHAKARTGDRAGAMAQLREFLSLNPTTQDVARAQQLMNQISDPFAGFPQSAKPKLEQAMEWLNTADVPQQAIVLFEEILRDFPDLAVVHALLGLAYQRLDDAGRAVDEYNRAIELGPEQGQTYVYLGDLYLSRQRPDSARTAFVKALEKNPLLDTANARLGDLALERQDFAEAKTRFERVKLLKPTDAASRTKLALVHELSADWIGAENELRQLSEMQPDNLELTLRLGMLLGERASRTQKPEERTKAASEARILLERVLQAQPENAAASRALETLPR